MGYKIKKTLELLKTEGMNITLRYCSSYLQYRLMGGRLLSIEDILYQQWRKRHELTGKQMEAMGLEVRLFRRRPLISVLTPTYNTDARLLRKAVESLERQIYPHWQLCIADDCSGKPETRAELERIEAIGKNIKIRYLEQNVGIAGTSNAALDLAEGEFVALLDHDDELSPDALFENVKLLNKHPEADFVYSDEDKLNEQGRHIEAFLKPDWSPEFLLANMYTCHLGVYRKSLLDKIGGFRAGFEGAQDYDLALRLTEQTRQIFHIPKVLYHWRRTSGSTSVRYQSTAGGKSAAESSLKALNEALERRGIKGSAERGKFAGTYRVRPVLPPESLVSIIIPTKDKVEYLRKCIDSILHLTRQPRFEIIIIDNNSVLPATKQYLSFLAHDGRIRLFPFPDAFNFSRMNNAAAAAAGGNTLLFLNNDTEVIEDNWLEAMLEMLQLPQVGVVGAKLLYPDNTVQHAGVALWHGGTAAHIHSRLPREEHGYCGMADTIRNCSAVSGACMMVERLLFDELQGFDPSFTVSYQDIDFCLRAAQKGFRTVYTPFALLSHHESSSTGRRKDEREERLFIDRWKNRYRDDPYYNCNFPPDRANFRLDHL